MKIFYPSTEEKVSALLQKRINELENGKADITKLFLEIQKGGLSVNPKFQLFEGKTGLQQVLKDMLLYRELETKAYWPIKSMIEILGEDFFRSHNKERIQRKLHTRAIWPENQIVDIKKNPYLGTGEKFAREIRIAPREIDFSMGYWIYDNKVAFISSKKECFGFIIESKELTEMLSSQFEMIWSASKTIECPKKETAAFLEEMNGK